MATTLSADQLAIQLDHMKLDMGKTNKQELASAEKGCNEFFNLKVPVNSEILDLCAGSGLVSASIQCHGYINVDALDEDMPTLRKLEKMNLYRNYIWREVAGIGSTGLKEESYDVVITAGGFSANALSPNDIVEVLRILRPDGHLILTMKPAQKEASTEFGLFEQNIKSLEKSGKCKIMKHENWSDPYTHTHGELYLIQRCVGRFPDYLDRPTPVELQKQIEQTLVDGADHGNTIKFYDAWSSQYDDDLVIVGNYNGYVKVAEAFLKLGLDHNVSILDVAAGTGLLGAEISRNGYVVIDGLDCSLGMLGQARKQNIYKNYIHATVEGIGSIPVTSDAYDVIVCSNGFAPGQIYPSALPELMRVLRPGGYALIAMKEGYSHISQRFALMDTKINDLKRSKKAELIIGPVIFKHFMLNNDGRFYMLRKPLGHTWATSSPHNSPKTARKQFL